MAFENFFKKEKLEPATKVTVATENNPPLNVKPPVGVAEESVSWKKVEQELETRTSTSIINALNHMLDLSLAMRASDIHIDPRDSGVAVRLRIDGVLQTVFTLPKTAHQEIISRIKILSGLRTDEHNSAQDGRFRHTTQSGKFIDIRVSIVPTYYGENCVMRLLAENSAHYTLESLGFSKSNQEKITKAIAKPYGMILVTGPTGSGKTTTLYTLIKMLNTEDVSIVTVEDPIEYSIDKINQIQVNARTQLTFANGLRSILRQDPNIIMVGEIRDSETAALAVNTALTGHLLLSTLHTNDAATTLPRLLDLKVEAFLIASTVNVAIGQRLLRKICDDCKTTKKITPKETVSISKALGLDISKKLPVFYYGSGCKACNNTGFAGRIGVHEVLLLENNIREAILRRASSKDLSMLAKENGMVSIVEDGVEKAAQGLTTIEEVLRMLYE